MMKQANNLVFIRHGATAGNLKKRYIGSTNEELLEESARLIDPKHYPEADVIFTSPLKRCIRTTQLIYPNQPFRVIEDLRECDFGEFEGFNYIELRGVSSYQRWVDSNGTLPFPNGESPELFKKRCINAFLSCVENLNPETRATFIVHNGTIMSILEALANEQQKQDYYEWSVDHLSGYSCTYHHGALYEIYPLTEFEKYLKCT